VRRPRREGQDLDAADSFRKAHVRRVHSCPPELRNNGDGIDTTGDAFRASGFTGKGTRIPGTHFLSLSGQISARIENRPENQGATRRLQTRRPACGTLRGSYG
jgi:hypothetical protein